MLVLTYNLIKINHNTMWTQCLYKTWYISTKIVINDSNNKIIINNNNKIYVLFLSKISLRYCLQIEK